MWSELSAWKLKQVGLETSVCEWFGAGQEPFNYYLHLWWRTRDQVTWGCHRHRAVAEFKCSSCCFRWVDTSKNWPTHPLRKWLSFSARKPCLHHKWLKGHLRVLFVFAAWRTSKIIGRKSIWWPFGLPSISNQLTDIPAQQSWLIFNDMVTYGISFFSVGIMFCFMHLHGMGMSEKYNGQKK